MTLGENKRLILIVTVLLNSAAVRVSGQCDAATRPLTLTATGSPQYLTSENYPNSYNASSDCAWIITSGGSTDKVIINIQDVDVEGLSSCKYDHFIVYDGGNDEATQLGDICNYNQDSLNDVVSTNDSLYITFTSDTSVQYQGFRILYFRKDVAHQPGCGADLTATSTTQVLMSENLPNTYDSSYNCNYTLTPDTLYFGILISFALQDIEADCNNDYLKVIEVSGSSSNVVYSGCTRAITYDIDDIEHTADSVLLSFVSDSAATNYLGFLITYTEIFKGINLTYPSTDDIVSMEISEDITSGSHLNTTVGYLDLTTTGSVQFITLERYTNGSDIPTTLVGIVPPALGSVYYITASTGYDYETSTNHLIVITMVDTADVPLLTYTVTFSIGVTDVDDVAPVFQNVPNNVTVYRSKTAGYSILNISAIDGDSTEAFSQVVYAITSGDDTYSMFSMNETTGELTLAKTISTTISLLETDFNLGIAAYSQSTSSSLMTTTTVLVYIPPDTPPVCTDTTVWGDTLDSYNDKAGKVVTYPSEWNCTDEYDIAYSLGTVAPDLTTTLFAIDATTRELTLARTFDIAEVPDRKFEVEVIATDSLGQTSSLTVSMNVTALSCSPNPRPLYARMDDTIDTVVLSDFQCTATTGLTYVLTQYPEGTFAVEGDVNETAKIILKAPIYKLRFYNLKAAISDGIDTYNLVFRITVQTRRCNFMLTSGSNFTLSHTMYYFVAAMFIYKL